LQGNRSGCRFLVRKSERLPYKANRIRQTFMKKQILMLIASAMTFAATTRNDTLAPCIPRSCDPSQGNVPNVE